MSCCDDDQSLSRRDELYILKERPHSGSKRGEQTAFLRSDMNASHEAGETDISRYHIHGWLRIAMLNLIQDGERDASCLLEINQSHETTVVRECCVGTEAQKPLEATITSDSSSCGRLIAVSRTYVQLHY
jgi:hypothetical protein